MLRVGPQSSNRNRLNEFAFRTLWAAIVFGFVFVLPIPTLHLVAQPPERSIPPSDRPLIPDRVPSILESGSVKPDAIHLRGSNGEAIYVPLQAYEEFEKFLREKLLGTVSSLPEQLLESLHGECRIRDGVADIDWTAHVQIRNSKTGVFRIPLGMANQNLTESPTIHRGATSFIRLAPAGGYEWCLQVEQNQDYEIQFRTRMKVNATGNQSMLRFALVEVPCRLKLILPAENQEVQASGSGVPVVETNVEGGVTNATIFGVGGALNVSWKDGSDKGATDAIEVESHTKWDIHAESRSWSGSTRFTIRPFGRKRSREFQVRLPLGMRWSPQQSPRLVEGLELIPIDQRIVQVKPLQGETEEITSAPSFRVRIADSVPDGPIDLDIAWEWTELPDSEGRFQLQGPICEGVQRHEGRVELNVPAGHRVGLSPSTDILFLQQERSSEQTSVTRYLLRFSNPNYRLAAVLSRDESQVRIRPRYAVLVESKRVALTGIIEFTVDPSTITDLRMHLGDWVLERLEQDGQTVDYDIVDEGAIQPRLTSANFESLPSGISGIPNQVRSMQITAHRPWAPSKGVVLRLELPKISSMQSNGTDRKFEHGTGGLLLSHASNVRLEPETQAFEGMIAEQRVPASMEELGAASIRTEGQYFRFQAETASPAWSGEWTKLERRISLRREIEVELNTSRTRISQLFRMVVENEPLQRLQLVAPRILIESSSPESTYLRVLLDGEPVDWSVVPLGTGGGLPASLKADDWGLIELSGGDYIGASDLQIDAAYGTPNLSLENFLPHSIQMVWPLLPEESEHLLDGKCELKCDSNIQCQIAKEFLAADLGEWGTIRSLAIPKGKYQVPCALKLLESAKLPQVQIDRIWMQSTLSSHQQRDRFVARFTTTSKAFQVSIPRDRKNQPYQDAFVLDGKRVEPLVIDDRYRFEIPETNSANTQHVLEIWSLLPRNSRLLNTIGVETPRFENSSHDFSFLWQVMLPPGESLIWSSPSLIPEYRWSWHSFGLSPQSDWSQSDLEGWTGASPQTAIGNRLTNYVLGCSGDGNGLWVIAVPRYMLWFPVGGIFLFGLVLWQRVSFFQRPITLVFVATIIAFLIPLATDFAILLVQSIAISCMLGIVVLVAQWVVDHRIQKRSVFANRHSTRIRSTSLDPSGRMLQGQSTTQSVEPNPAPLIAESQS